MKIAILSMQRVNNYGSLLQAYGLKNIILRINKDAEVEFLDIVCNDKDNSLLNGIKADHSNEFENCGFIQKVSKHFFNRIRNKIIMKKNNKHFERFRTTKLELMKKSDRYNLCVIGSDEVFNCVTTEKWGYSSQLFGNVPQADKVITYAASCGSTTVSDLPNGVIESIKDSFKNINGFSARDRNTESFIRSICDKEVVNNLDPVLIYDFSKEVSEAKMPKTPNRFCLIYAYANRIFKDSDINAILDFCKAHNLTPIAVGGGQSWCRKYIECSPFECLKLFQKAEFVITDTFHGTIFSSKYAKKFCVLIRNSNSNKLNDLIEKLNLDQHRISDFSELETAYGRTHDKESFNKIIETARKKSFEYLNRFCK